MNNTAPRSAPRLGWKFPAALLVLTAFTYGPLIPGLGVYWDDWPSLWFVHAFGPEIFPRAFAIDRPAQGWLFALTTSVFGEWMPGWHLFGILARWLCALAFAWVLRQVWPRRIEIAIWGALLFVVYPGFLQQWIPITYGHQFLVYTAFWTSVALMLLAARMPEFRRQLTIISLALAVWGMFALEYFFGLEFLRPVFLWLVFNDLLPDAGWDARARKTLFRWMPYAIAAALFLVWRVTNPTPRGSIVLFERLAADLWQASVELAGRIAADVFTAAAAAWVRAASYLNPTGVKTSVLAAYGLTLLAAAALTAWLLYSFQSKTPANGRAAQSNSPSTPDSSLQPAPKTAYLQAGLVGVYALLIGGWPVWVTDLRLELAFPWDRFTLALIPGSVLLIISIVGLLTVPRPWVAIAAISLLVGISAGMHLHNGLTYRRDWMEQRAFFWQLAWRAPALNPGTMLLVSAAPFAYATDNSLSAPLNWVYSIRQHLNDFDMDYLLYSLDARLGSQLPALIPDQPVVQDYRATRFSGSTSQALVLFYDPPRCLKVVDPVRDELLPNKPDNIAEAMPLSQPDLILSKPDAASPMVASLFGPEPERNWCYYFERAELAVQSEDWPTAAALADEALAANPEPSRAQAYEMTPFIRAYALTGRWEQALTLTGRAARLSDKMPPALCALWEDIADRAVSDPEMAGAHAQARRDLNCPIE